MIRVASLTIAGLALTAAAAEAQTTAPAATAQASAAPTVGATVYGSDGQSLGTVDSVTASAIVLNTGTSKVAVPPTSIGKGANGLTMQMTKQQLTAAQAQQQQQASASVASKLVPGTAVAGVNGTPVATIKAADAQYVTLTASNGRDAKLPVSGFSVNPQGQVIIGMTADQLLSATGGAAPAGTTSSTTSSTTTTAPADSATAAPNTDTTATGTTSQSTTTTTKSTTKKTKR